MVYLLGSALENKDQIPEGLSLLKELTAFINKVSIKVMGSSDLDFS